MKKWAIIVVVLLAYPAKAANEVENYLSGNDLWEWCKGGNDSACMGYVLGVVDQWLRTKPRICAEGVTRGQITDVVIKFLRDEPENRHYVAASIVELAASRAFACVAK